METIIQHQSPDSFYSPYIKKQYECLDFCVNHSVSPNNKYFVVEQNKWSSNSIEIILFEICESKVSEPFIKYCGPLLVLDEYSNNKFVEYTWSASGYKFICEYETTKRTNKRELYNIVYFDINNNNHDTNPNTNTNPNPNNYNKFSLFADDKYKWEHNMNFSADDNILITVYKRETLRIFNFDHVNKNYIFKTELTIPDVDITNIYLLPDNKLIVSIHKNQTTTHNSYNSIIAYQINDDLSDIIQLTSNDIPASDSILKFTKYTHDTIDYLVYYLSNGVSINTRIIYIYNLTTLNLHNIIDLHTYNIYIDAYAWENYLLAIHTTTHELTLFNLISKVTSNIQHNFIHTDINSLSNSKYFTTKTYRVYELIPDTHIIVHSQSKSNTINEIKQFTTHPFESRDSANIFKYKYKLFKNTNINHDNTELKLLHNNTNYIIYTVNNDIYIGNSLQYCYDKNVELVIQMLYDYIPVELCCKIASYI